MVFENSFAKLKPFGLGRNLLSAVPDAGMAVIIISVFPQPIPISDVKRSGADNKNDSVSFFIVIHLVCGNLADMRVRVKSADARL